jgi:predicted dehydrogenase
MKSKIRVGLVGLGRIATATHLPVLNTLENVEIIAGADVDVERINRVKSLYNFMYVYNDFSKLFEMAGELDAVYICLPPSLHSVAVIEALNKGLDVFCEKPMGLSSKESREMINISERNSLILMPGYKWCFNKNITKAKRFIESGILGKIVQVQAVFMTPGPYISWDPKSDWYFDEFGALYDTGCHIINLLQYLIPNRFEMVNAYTVRGHLGYNTPTNIACIFKLEGNAIGTLDIGWRGSVDTLSISIHGTAGILNVSPKFFQYFNLGVDSGDRIFSYLQNAYGEARRTMNRIVNMIKSINFSSEDFQQSYAFIRSVSNRTCPPISAKDAFKTTCVLETLKKSIEDREDSMTTIHY